MRDRDGPRPGGFAGLAGREIRVDQLVAMVVRYRVAAIIGVGIVFRVGQYLADRPYWLDELSLLDNVERMTWSRLFAPMINNQLAPPGFLAVEWLDLRAFGNSSMASRLFPLLCGIASLWLIHAVARRCLRPAAVLIALALFAVSDDQIYFASELKPYATDVVAALGCLLAGLSMAEGPATPVRRVAFGVMGCVVVWFSFPSAFVLAGVGTVLLISSAAGGRWRDALWLALACLAWGASFAALHAVAANQLGHRRDMWAFWRFAFPPLPFGSLHDLAWWPRRLCYLFINPLDFGPGVAILPALGFFLAGCLVEWRRKRWFWMLASPFLFTVAAACLHLYPFHGRLVLFLAPILLILIAAGAAWLGETLNRRAAWCVLLATILLVPTLRAVARLVEPRQRVTFNSHGDNRPEGQSPDASPL